MVRHDVFATVQSSGSPRVTTVLSKSFGNAPPGDDQPNQMLGNLELL